MPRFQTDDTFGDSLPAKRAGTAALGLYYLCGMWSARYTTDGLVPTEVAADYGTAEWARKLVDAGLWLVVDGGYLMPRFLDDNPSAEKVAKERQAKAERQAKWLEKTRNPSSNQRRVSRPSSRASKDASRDALGDVPPPLPSPKGEGVGGAPLREGAPPPTRTTRDGHLICSTHHLELPCRGCVADARVDDDLADLDQRPPVPQNPNRRPHMPTTRGPGAEPPPAVERDPEHAAAVVTLSAVAPELVTDLLGAAAAQFALAGKRDPSERDLTVRAAALAEPPDPNGEP